LSEHLGYALKRAQLDLRRFSRCVAPLQLTPAQFSVLLLLDKKSGTQPDRNRQHARNPQANFVRCSMPGKPRPVHADALGPMTAAPTSCPDRQGPGGAGAGEELVAAKPEARLNALLGPVNRAALLAMLATIAREF